MYLDIQNYVQVSKFCRSFKICCYKIIAFTYNRKSLFMIKQRASLYIDCNYLIYKMGNNDFIIEGNIEASDSIN